MVNFTKKQKKRIKKELRYKTIAQTAKDFHISENNLNEYLTQNKTYFEDVLAFEDEAPVDSGTYPPFIYKLKRIAFHPVFIVLLLSAIIFIIYYSSLGNVFISDDIPGIVKNRAFNSLQTTLSSSKPFILRPLVIFSIIKMGGMNPAYLRLSTIILHILVSIVVYIFLKKILKSKLLGFTGAVLFAVHPVMSESVVWITSGYHVQYTLFVLISLYFYILYTEKNKLIYLLTSYVISILAFATSEKALVLPLLMFLYAVSFGILRKRWKSLGFYALVLIGSTSFVISGVQTRIQQFTTIIFTNSGYTNPLIIPAALTHYIKLLFVPLGLSFYPAGWTLIGVNALFYILVIIGIGSALWYGWKKNRVVLFLIGFFILSLSPMLLPLNIYAWGAERYVYLASIGIIALQILILDKIASFLPIDKGVIFAIFLLTVPLVFGYLTMQRTADWKTESAFANAAARVAGDSENVHNNLGLQFYKRGEYEQAVSEFSKTLEINPNFAEAYLNMANAYKQSNQINKAVETYKKALTIFPECWQCHTNLGIISYEEKDVMGAVTSFEKAVAINNQEPQLLNNLSVLYLEMGQIEKAKQILMQSLALEPNDEKIKQLYDSIQ